jgi:sulfur-oxidizing protein SoxX
MSAAPRHAMRLVLAAGLCCLHTCANAADGRELFLDPAKGRCASCHQAPRDAGVKSLSTIGPPLLGMDERYPDKARLIEDIADLSRRLPATVMPPYARHRLLTDAEIAAIARYVSTL